MSNRKMLVAVLSCVGAALVATTVLMAGPADKHTATRIEGKTSTMEGRVVDIGCYMTGQYPSTDKAKCTAECIRNGVPACLETPHGLIILGDGAKSASSKLIAYAYENAKITGKVYERDGVKYMDIDKIEKSNSPTAAGHPITNAQKTSKHDAKKAKH